MVTTTPTWSAEQTGLNATISAGSDGDTNIDLATNGWDIVAGMVDVTLASSSGVTVYIYRSTDSGTDFATGASLPGGFTVSADGVYPLPTIMGEDYVRVRVTNDDGSNATGTVTVTYQGRKWDTT